MRVFKLLLPLIMLCAVQRTFAAGCTWIIYVNGINTDNVGAGDDLHTIESAWQGYALSTPHANDCVHFQYVWNQNQGFMADIGQSIAQALNLSLTTIFTDNDNPGLDSLNGSAVLYDDLISIWSYSQEVLQDRIAISSNPDPDLGSLIAAIGCDLFPNNQVLGDGTICSGDGEWTGDRVILLTHSQGDFYANFAYEAMKTNSDLLQNRLTLPDNNILELIELADPATYVADGRYQYLTVCNDPITFVPDSLPQNEYIGSLTCSWPPKLAEVVSGGALLAEDAITKDITNGIAASNDPAFQNVLGSLNSFATQISYGSHLLANYVLQGSDQLSKVMQLIDNALSDPYCHEDPNCYLTDAFISNYQNNWGVKGNPYSVSSGSGSLTLITQEPTEDPASLLTGTNGGVYTRRVFTGPFVATLYFTASGTGAATVNLKNAQDKSDALRLTVNIPQQGATGAPVPPSGPGPGSIALLPHQIVLNKTNDQVSLELDGLLYAVSSSNVMSGYYLEIDSQGNNTVQLSSLSVEYTGGFVGPVASTGTGNPAPQPPVPTIQKVGAVGPVFPGEAFDLFVQGSSIVPGSIQVWVFDSAACQNGCRHPDTLLTDVTPTELTAHNIQLDAGDHYVMLRNTDSGSWSNTSNTFTVTAPANPLLGSVVTLSDSPFFVNDPLTVTVNAGNIGLSTSGIIVDVEIYNSAGTQVSQTFFANQNFPWGSSNPYLVNWTPTATDTYTVKVGLFDSEWSALENWNDNAATFTVTAPTSPIFSSAAYVTPATPATNQSVTASVNVTNAGAAANGVIVDVEIYNGVGTQVNQTVFDNQTFAAGSSASYNVTWTPTSADTYTVKIGLFSSGWASEYNWNNGATIFTVANATPTGPGFAASATVSPAAPTVNQTVTVTLNVTDSGTAAAGIIVDVEIYNNAGVRVYQQFFSNQTFAQGASAPYTVTWTPTTTGLYTAKVGIFASSWASEYTWNNNAAAFTVAPSTQTGTVNVSATLNGQSYVGTVNCGLAIPNNGQIQMTSVPFSQTNQNLGTYTLSCLSGPSGSSLSQISPSGTQTLAAGSNISYVLQFVSTSSALTASCSASPSTATTGSQIDFQSGEAGGIAPYSYGWSGSASGNSPNILIVPNSAGTYTEYLTVTDSSNPQKTATASCSAQVSAPPAFNVGCSISPNPIALGQGTTVIASAIGGSSPDYFTINGVYTGTSNSQLLEPTQAGTYTASVSATDSGGHSASGSCTAQVNGVAPTVVGYVWSPSVPEHGQNFGGTIDGSGFVSGALVYFCVNSSSTCYPQPAAGVMVNGLTQISVSNVNLSSGSWQVYIQSPYGTSARSTAFTVQ